MRQASRFNVRSSTKYLVRCFDKDGNLKWEDGFHNIVVTAGLNKLLDATFKSGYVAPLWYIGLKNSSAGVSAADTMASHGGWTEGTPYSNASRPQFLPGTINSGVVDNVSSVAVFDINDTDTIYGGFLVNDDAKGGTSGTLYGAGDFVSPRAVISGDTLEVTTIITQTTA